MESKTDRSSCKRAPRVSVRVLIAFGNLSLGIPPRSEFLFHNNSRAHNDGNVDDDEDDSTIKEARARARALHGGASH
jgi:hypothetical protein